jgi:CCR4-NOT transcription complex subunit 7/8
MDAPALAPPRAPTHYARYLPTATGLRRSYPHDPDPLHIFRIRRRRQRDSPEAPRSTMPPAVGRMHASHMSNPFVHLNPAHSIPQSHYPQQQHALPQPLTRPSNYPAVNGFAPPTSNAALQNAYASAGALPGPNPGQGVGGGTGLGSEAAYRGFAHGAALQQQQAHQAEAAQLGLKSGLAGRIREVWAHNLEHEMVLLRQLITKYPYVSMVRCCP